MLALVLLFACHRHEAADDSASDVVDLRGDFPDAPTEGQQWLTPDITIPAYTEKQYCYFLEYDGEDVGITSVDTYQSQYGHHVLMLESTASEDEHPNGSLFDCTDADDLIMTAVEPIIYGPIVAVDGVSQYSLPDGMGARLNSGTRIVLQSHYVNTSADDILVHDAINLGYAPEDEIETWTAPIVNTGIDFTLPAGEQTSVELDCAIEAEGDLLFLTGHMHEWGSAITVDHQTAEGTSRIYEVPSWMPEYRDVPPFQDYVGAPYHVSVGDHFITTCTWFNTEDHDMTFPEEMCAAFGMFYPSKVPLICTPF